MMVHFKVFYNLGIFFVLSMFDRRQFCDICYQWDKHKTVMYFTGIDETEEYNDKVPLQKDEEDDQVMKKEKISA